MKHYRLMSKKQNAPDWGIRNDRYHICDPSKSRWTDTDALEKARREMNSWQLIEPNTEFRIEVQEQHGGEWKPIRRNS